MDVAGEPIEHFDCLNENGRIHIREKLRHVLSDDDAFRLATTGRRFAICEALNRSPAPTRAVQDAQACCCSRQDRDARSPDRRRSIPRPPSSYRMNSASPMIILIRGISIAASWAAIRVERRDRAPAAAVALVKAKIRPFEGLRDDLVEIRRRSMKCAMRVAAIYCVDVPGYDAQPIRRNIRERRHHFRASPA